MPDTALDKNALDVSQIFQTYMAFGGDVDKTAVACNEDPETIAALANSENWKAKIAQLSKLTDGNSNELQVQINRAVNYVQAHRIRSIIDKVIGQLTEKDGKELIDLCTKVGKNGEAEFSARPLADLVKAAEACQAMTQRALGDTAAERPEENGKSAKGSSISLQVMAAMNAADAAGMNSVEVVRKELAAPVAPLAMGD
jgi:hypothetical protein